VRSRRSGPLELSETLAALALKVPPSVERPPLPFLQWERAVGTRIAGRARPVRLERGVLHVKASSGVWASELQLLSADILESLRAAGIEVNSLRFSVGKVEGLPPPPPEKRAPRPLPLPSELAAAVEQIGDDALRDALRRAASVSLGAAAEAAVSTPRGAGARDTRGEDGRGGRTPSGRR